MVNLKIEAHEDIVAVLNKIKNINESGIEIFIPEGSVLFDSIINLKLLEKEVSKQGKVVHFNTNDAIGLKVLQRLKDDTPIVSGINSINHISASDLDFDSVDNMEATYVNTLPNVQSSKQPSKYSQSVKFNLGFLTGIKNFLNTYLHGSFTLFLLIGAVVFVSVIYYVFGYYLPRAQVNITLKSQPLVRSFTVSLAENGAYNADENNLTLNGKTVNATVTKTASIPVTGEKLEGDKAKGKVLIYNKTDTSKTFKKGTKLYFNADNDDLVFILSADINVPKSSEETDTSGSPIIKPGEAVVDAEAENFGSSYNISEGEKLSISNEKTSQFDAKVNKKFEGGNSKKVKVVAAVDMLSLKDSIGKDIEAESLSELKKKISRNEKVVSKSLTTASGTESFSAKEGDKVENLELIKNAESKALVYSDEDLKKMIKDLIKTKVPEGYVLFEEDPEFTVDELTNASSAGSASLQYKLQVTVKANVIPNLDVEKLKVDLVGKNTEDAKKLFESLRSTGSTDFRFFSNYIFVNSFPKKANNISIIIKRD